MFDFWVWGRSGIVKEKGIRLFDPSEERVVLGYRNPREPFSSRESHLQTSSTGSTAFSAILRALILRGRTAVGVDLKVTVFDATANWINRSLLAHSDMGSAPERSALKHSFTAPYGTFTCSDGEQVLLSVQSNREFYAL
jgi:hypothetical protein